MTADKHFNLWMRRAAVLFAMIFAYILLTDVTIPMTPHSMVQRPVLSIAPQVTGEVVDVNVRNNQAVKAGELLFRLDPRDYQLAVEKAELALQEASQANDGLRAQLQQAAALVVEAKATQAENVRELHRLQLLKPQKLVSQQQLDKALSQQQTADARLLAVQESYQVVLVQLGEEGTQNLRIRQATNALAQAKLNLSRTEIHAPDDGVISNLQLVPGMQAQARQALLSLVLTEKERISADFREKTLMNLPVHATAWVVFDALPGQVFAAHLESRDLGVANGQLAANGVLAAPETSDRWVRDAQRVRVYLDTDKPLPATLVSGSRATVMLSATDNALLKGLGQVQMKLISLLHYVY